MNDYLVKSARNDDEKHLIARLHDLAQRAAHGAGGQSGFLDLRQQELAEAVAVNETSVVWHLDGGYQEAERKRLVVYPDWEAESDPRIAFVQISHKYKDQSIAHRDYLGAVLNLGLKREKLGDIVVQNSGAFLIADIDLVDFICRQLTRVKHCSVLAEVISSEEFVFKPPDSTALQVSMASLRLDAAIAAAFNLSRSDVDSIIETGNVKINHMETSKSSAPVKAGDLISVRGLGRFRLEEVGGLSRKGRYHVHINKIGLV